MNNLLERVNTDIINFFESQRMFFFNERDLQVNLAFYLSTLRDRDYKLHLEYHIPRTELNDYPWIEKNISIDLVVVKNGEYVPIELKYKTRSLPKDSEIDRFGVSLKADAIIKNQSAQDLGRYGFWKDVKRLEQINERYKNVIGGIAVFVTNDESYTKKPKNSSVGYYDFRMFPGEKIGNTGSMNSLTWRKDGIQYEPKKKSSCSFKLKSMYIVPEWKNYEHHTDYENQKMFYNIVIVK